MANKVYMVNAKGPLQAWIVATLSDEYLLTVTTTTIRNERPSGNTYRRDFSSRENAKELAELEWRRQISSAGRRYRVVSEVEFNRLMASLSPAEKAVSEVVQPVASQPPAERSVGRRKLAIYRDGAGGHS